MADINHLYLGMLVRKAQAHDSNAFAELYGLTYQKQYNYACYYLKDTHLAQDAVQEVYIHVLKHIGDIKDPKLFLAWLNQITFHTCFDMAKKQDRHYGEINPLALELSEDEYIDHNPESLTQKQDEIDRLKAAINALPALEQQVIVLKFFNNLTIDEIVKATGISRSTIKRHLASGKEHLAAAMST